MKRKYYMRGLGFGILITTLVFVCLNPSEPTDEEIIKRAEELGYVLHEPSATPGINLDELIGKETPAPTKATEERLTPEPTKVPTTLTLTPEPTEVPATLTPIPVPTLTLTPTNTPEPTPTEVPKATDTPFPTPTVTVIKSQINIVRGTTASQICRMIEEAGIIEDWEDYKSYLLGRGLTSEINIGTFELSSDMTYEDITRIITGK